MGPAHLLGEAGQPGQVTLDPRLTDECSSQPPGLALERAAGFQGRQSLAKRHAAYAQQRRKPIFSRESVARDQVAAADQLRQPAGDGGVGR